MPLYELVGSGDGKRKFVEISDEDLGTQQHQPASGGDDPAKGGGWKGSSKGWSAAFEA